MNSIPMIAVVGAGAFRNGAGKRGGGKRRRCRADRPQCRRGRGHAWLAKQRQGFAGHRPAGSARLQRGCRSGSRCRDRALRHAVAGAAAGRARPCLPACAGHGGRHLCQGHGKGHRPAVDRGAGRGSCPAARLPCLSGPGFAADIARGLPTAMVIAARTAEIGATLAQALSGPTFRLYPSTDRIGVQLGGALKNVLAIACGIVEGAGLGDSARAALISRGLCRIVPLRRGAWRRGHHGHGALRPSATSS